MEKLEKENINVLEPFKLFVLQNFPFIEADFDSLTNYGIMSKMVEYMNTINDNINILAENDTTVFSGFNAVVDFLTTYFENLNLQEEVNVKLDEMATNGILTSLIKQYVDPFINEQNRQINDIASRVTSNNNGSPLVANSVSEMVNTSRIYVNISDGYWYYYNGSSWTRGAIYQSTGLGNNVITKYNLNNQLQNDIYTRLGTADIMIRDGDDLGLVPTTDQSSQYYHKLHQSSSLVGFIVPVKAGETVTVTKRLGARFRVATTTDLPAEGVTYNQYKSNENNNPISFTLGDTDNYLFIIYYSNSLDVDLTKEEIKESMKVYYGEWEDEITKLDTFKEELANQGVKHSYIKDGAVSEDKTSFMEKKAGSNNLYNDFVPHVGLVANIDQSSANYGKFVTSSTLYGFYIPVTPNTTINVQKTKGERFRIATSSNVPAPGVSYNQRFTCDNETIQSVDLGATDNYLFVNYYSETYDTLTEEEIKKSIKVYYGDWVDEDYNIASLKNRFSNFSNEVLNLFSYRQLGSFDKGYLCMVADDGHMTLSTNTFSILRRFNVPCTFALMSNSPIMNEETGDINGLKEMINDYGCSVCQHGSTPFDEYGSEEDLTNFLKSEQEFWQSKNITVKGLCYPWHHNNQLIRAICGSMYDVCCGGSGNNYITTNYQLNTERSNIFALSRTSIVSYQYLQQAIDYAVENNKLMIVFWHDDALVNTPDYQTILENFITYAKNSGITFTTLDKILTL